MEKTIWIGSLSGPNLKSNEVIPKTALYMPQKLGLPLS
jgi:hypothetical protein